MQPSSLDRGGDLTGKTPPNIPIVEYEAPTASGNGGGVTFGETLPPVINAGEDEAPPILVNGDGEISGETHFTRGVKPRTRSTRKTPAPKAEPEAPLLKVISSSACTYRRTI